MDQFEDEVLKLTEQIHKLKNSKHSKKKIKIEKSLVDGTDVLCASGFFGNTSESKTIKHYWTPPRSPYNLVQEVLHHDEWQLLLATMFLNKTSCQKAIPQLWVFLNKWSSAEAVCNANMEDIVEVLKPLGLHEKRAQLIKNMSVCYLKGKWKNPRDLPGIGKYGDDSYKIFCEGKWKKVNPTDKKLRKYIEFLSSKYSGLKARRTEAQI
ncbi:hypothetical protein L9F63_014733 [Diploptera punctata]|uniref:DNA glycosylase n=1 Tax=Diploptera punctata TaxID=6984 RepID=A0AAD8A7N6_DIPPU|nr:hypothetical protein L9F63_014733 [Diploptera punctata]